MEQGLNLLKALANNDEDAIGHALEELDSTISDEADETDDEPKELFSEDEIADIMFGISEGFRLATAIMKLDQTKRQEIFGTNDVISILKDDVIDIVEACIDNDVVKTMHFSAGDKVIWRDEVIAVLSDDGDDEVTVIDDTFHTFQVNRHELKPLT